VAWKIWCNERHTEFERDGVPRVGILSPAVHKYDPRPTFPPAECAERTPVVQRHRDARHIGKLVDIKPMLCDVLAEQAELVVVHVRHG
jgi:hypothetical protein